MPVTIDLNVSIAQPTVACGSVPEDEIHEPGFGLDRGLRGMEVPFTSDPLPNSFGQDIQLGYVRDARLRVIVPFTVQIAEDGGQFFAEAVGTEEFGAGATRAEAVSDLAFLLGDLYFSLEDQEAHLGPALQRTLELLRSHLRELAV